MHLHICPQELAVILMFIPFVRWAFEGCRYCWRVWLCRDKAHHDPKVAP